MLYASGEESPEQIRLRADRLLEDAGPVLVLGETRLEAILEAARAARAELLVLDSIQTVYTDSLESAPGQCRPGPRVRRACSCGSRRRADRRLSSWVTSPRAATIAGPKTLEHIVDTVLYFEGEGLARLSPAPRHQEPVRLRGRAGRVHDDGAGLVPVAEPFRGVPRARAREGTSGSAVTALMEGTRPVLVEVQALAAPSGYGTPQRVATGLDPRRLAVLLAVLERRGGAASRSWMYSCRSPRGSQLREPARRSRRGGGAALQLHNRPTPADAIYLGEIGLGGEVRPIGGLDRRLVKRDDSDFAASSRPIAGPRAWPD